MYLAYPFQIGQLINCVLNLNEEGQIATTQKKIAKVVRYFGIIMAIFYFMLGLTVAFYPLFKNIELSTRYGISLLLILYGCYRFYRIFNTTKS
jgi:hypothetical protein